MDVITIDATPPAAPDPAPVGTLSPVPGQATRQVAPRGLGALFGRIGTRAWLIALLMLGVVGVLTGTALQVMDMETGLVQVLAIRDRAADDAVDAMVERVASLASTYAGVIAGVLPPPAASRRLKTQGALLIEAFTQVEAQLGGEIDTHVLDAARSMTVRLPALLDTSTEVFTARDRSRFGALHEEWIDHSFNYDRLTAAARDVIKERNTRTMGQASAIHALALRIIIGAGAIGLLGIALIWFVLVQLIARPISRIAGIMGQLAQGRTEHAIPGIDRSDQIGEMARALVVFRDNLRATAALMDQALQNARHTAVATSQASDAIGQISDGATTQLSELRRVGEALAQSADAVRDVVRSTAEAADRAGEARTLLSGNLVKVRTLIELVDAVGEDTERVTRIAGTIARIATQTNILAINAAIEAARAGEHGRGLAVVAEEVRALAVSSESLAQEIADVVEVAGRRTREGSGTAAAVGEAIDELERLVAASARLTGSIAVAMEQQQAMVSDINDRIAVLDRIGQSNATAAEEITVTMIELSRLATETRHTVESMAVAPA